MKKRWLIVGATGGLGSAISKEFARRGYSLVLLDVADRKEHLSENASDLVNRYGVDVVTGEFREGNVSSYRQLLESYHNLTPRIDGVLWATGVMWPQDELQENPDRMVDQHNINYTVPALFLEVAAGWLNQRGGGQLAVIGSPAGDRGRKSNYFYGADKAALHTLLEGMRHRYASSTLAITTIKPGPTRTPMTDGSGNLPLLAEPEDQARIIINRLEKKKAVIYTPPIWQVIMLVIRHLPRFVFDKLNL